MGGRRAKPPVDDARVARLASDLVALIVRLGDEPCPQCGQCSLTFEPDLSLRIVCLNEGAETKCGFTRFYSFTAPRQRRGSVVALAPKPRIGVLIDPFPNEEMMEE